MSVIQQKLLAFAIHLGLGLIVVASFLYYIWFVAYTPPIIDLEGGGDIILLLLAVDVTLGPILTLILYRKGKPGMKLDIAVVLTVQIAAFALGAWTLYSQRPLYLAFVAEHFRVIPASGIDLDELTDEALAPSPFGGPRTIYVERPKGEMAQKIMFEALDGGRDLHEYPQFYRPYNDNLEKIRASAWTLERLRNERPSAVTPIEQRLAELNITESDTLIAPVIGFQKEAAILLDRESGRLLAFVDVVIW